MKNLNMRVTEIFNWNMLFCDMCDIGFAVPDVGINKLYIYFTLKIRY